MYEIYTFNTVSIFSAFYSSRANRGKHFLGQPFKRNQLCVFSDEANRYHRAVIDIEPSFNSDIVAVRNIDTGIKSEVASSCLYRIAQEFKEYKCFARRCALCDVRPFNATAWNPKSQEVFGTKHTDKLYFAKIMSPSDQVCFNATIYRLYIVELMYAWPNLVMWQGKGCNIFRI